MMLQRPFVEIGHGIVIGMIKAQSFEECEVESRLPGIAKNGEIGVVGHSAKHVLGKRTAERMGGSSGKLAHQPSVLIPGLHEQHWATTPARFKVHDEPDI